MMLHLPHNIIQAVQLVQTPPTQADAQTYSQSNTWMDSKHDAGTNSHINTQADTCTKSCTHAQASSQTDACANSWPDAHAHSRTNPQTNTGLTPKPKPELTLELTPQPAPEPTPDPTPERILKPTELESCYTCDNLQFQAHVQPYHSWCTRSACNSILLHTILEAIVKSALQRRTKMQIESSRTYLWMLHASPPDF